MDSISDLVKDAMTRLSIPPPYPCDLSGRVIQRIDTDDDLYARYDRLRTKNINNRICADVGGRSGFGWATFGPGPNDYYHGNVPSLKLKRIRIANFTLLDAPDLATYLANDPRRRRR